MCKKSGGVFIEMKVGGFFAEGFLFKCFKKGIDSFFCFGFVVVILLFILGYFSVFVDKSVVGFGR